MNSIQVHAFAKRLMREVWEPFDAEQLSTFYHKDVVGHHRTQMLSYNDIVNRLAWDRKHSADPVFDIKGIIADEDKFSIRFIYSATEIATWQKFEVEVIYFYHLQEAKSLSFGCWPVSILITRRRPNQAMQPTAGRHTASLLIAKTRSLQSTHAFSSRR
jgi:hypothetical protein